MAAKPAEPMVVVNEGDPVVHEIPVMFSSGLAPHVNVLQFPLRGKEQPYDLSSISRLRHKKGLGLVDIDFRRDQDSANYDPNSENEAKTSTLSSSSIPLKTNYMLGKMKDGKLYLVPVNSVVQMRPSFAHIDAADALKNASTKKEPTEEEPDDGGLKPIQVKFKRRESEKAAAARQRSHAHLKKLEEEEPWIVLTNAKQDADGDQDMNGEDIPEKFFTEEMVSLAAQTDKKEYYEQLNPASQEIAMTIIDPLDQPLSKDALSRMSAGQQVRALIQNAHVMAFHRICQLASRAKNEADVLSELHQIAHVIQGCWVEKSELRYQGHLALSRDFLLYKLATDRYVPRKTFVDATRLTADETKEILTEVAVFRGANVGWELKKPLDDDFVERYPQVVTSHENWWQEAGPSIVERLSESLSERLASSSKGKMRAADKSGGGSSSRNGGDKGKGTGVGNTARSDGDVTMSTAAKSEERRPLPGERLQYLASSPFSFSGSTVEEQLNKYFEEIFGTYGVCEYQFLRDQLVLRQSEEVDNNLLASGVSKTMFDKHLGQLSREVLPTRYVLKDGGSSGDDYRTVIIDAFAANPNGLRKQEIKTAVKEALDKDIPQSAYTRILKEVAVCRSGNWVLKSGVGND